MTQGVMEPTPRTDGRTAFYFLAGYVALTVFVYRPILIHMFETWADVPDYSHGFLVLPLAIYFAYERKFLLARARVEGSWWGVGLLLVGLFSLMLGELGGLLTALRSGFIFTVMGLVLLLAGREVFKILFFPIAFTFLMVPLPQSLVNVVAFPLQLAVQLSRPGVDFEGGEFLLTEQRPRMQSRGDAVALERGEGILFPNAGGLEPAAPASDTG